jgi:hypothetical protein
MPKNATNWVNNDVKAPQGWTPATKSQDQWANNDVKNLTAFSSPTKSTDAWNPNIPANQNYQYDNPDMTYDSVLWFYNSLVNNNTANQRLVTKWANN